VMSHLRDAAWWYWPGGAHCYGMFALRGARPSEVEASPAEAALSIPWVAAFSASLKKGDGEDEDKHSTASTRVRAEAE
jgi:hypothetical protein